MEILGNLYSALFVNPTINGLVLIYTLLSAIGIPYALGFSIIALTALIRLALAPFTASQAKLTKKMQELNPQIKKIKERYKGDQMRIQKETSLLFQQHGVNPLGGCLPSLLQLFLFFALYGVFIDFLKADPAQTIEKFNSRLYVDSLKLTEIADQTFFGLPLTKSPHTLMGELGFLILLIPIVTGVLQLLQTKMMFTTPPEAKDAKKDIKKTDEPDFSAIMQKQMIFIIPFMIALSSFNFPLGLSLYWNTFTIFAIIQQYKLNGWGGLHEWKEKFFPSPAKAVVPVKKKHGRK